MRFQCAARASRLLAARDLGLTAGAAGRLGARAARGDRAVREAELAALLAVAVAGVLRTAGRRRAVARRDHGVVREAEAAQAGGVVHVEAAHDGLAPAGIVVPTADPALTDPCLITRTSERNVVLARLCAADTAVVIVDASRSSRLGAARGEEERNRDAD